MRIDSYAQLLSASTSTTRTNTTSASTTTGSSDFASLFGPAFELTLSADAQEPGTGVCRIYSQVIAKGGVAPARTTVWQYNITGVLSTAGVGTASMQTARSSEQTKAEDAAVQQALDLVNQGQNDGARELVNQVLEENATNSAALQVLGFVEMSESNYDKAEQLFLKAHAVNPTVGYDQDATNARILQADDETVLQKARAMVASPTQRASGITILANLTERSPTFTAAHVLLGEALLDNGDAANGLLQYSTAIRTADVAELDPIAGRLQTQLEATPDSAFVWQLLGKLQVRQGRYDDALQSLNQAIKLTDDKSAYNGELAKAYVGVGRDKLARGDITGAMSDFTLAKTLSPTGTEVKAALGEGYVRRAEQKSNRLDYAGAADDYTLAATLLDAKSDKNLRARAADGAYAAGLKLKQERIASGADIDAEMTAFQAAYNLDKSDLTHKRALAEARSALGDQYAADGELEEAAAAHQQALDLFQYDATYKAKAINAHIAHADDRLANLNYSDAVDAYRAAYKIDMFNVTSKTKLAAALTARGLDYKEQDKMKLAALDFKDALRLFPDNAEYQANYDSVSPWDT